MKIMKTKAAVDHQGLLTIPVIPAGLTPGEQVEVVLASRGDEAAPLLLLTQAGIEVAIPSNCFSPPHRKNYEAGRTCFKLYDCPVPSAERYLQRVKN